MAVYEAYYGQLQGEPGHVAVIRPGFYYKDRGPWIAQAGGKNYNRATVSEGFGKRPVEYYIYDERFDKQRGESH